MGMFDDNPNVAAPAAAPPGVARSAPPSGNMFDDSPGVVETPATQRAKEQAGMSWPAYLGQGAKDLVMGAGDMFSFGMGPRLDAGLDVLKGKGLPLPDAGWTAQPDYATALEARQKDLAERRERSPVATTAGNVAGGAAGGVASGASRIGANVAARLGGSLPARVAGYGTEGAVQGAAQGAGHTYTGDPADIATNAVKGGTVGGVIGGAIGGAVPQSAVALRPGSPTTGQPIPIPTRPEVRGAASNQYQTLSQIPATYSGQHFNQALAAAEQRMSQGGAFDVNAAAVYRVMENLRTGRYGFANQAGDIGPMQIETARQALSGMKNTTGPGEKAGYAANVLRQQLDNFLVQAPQAGAVTSAPQLGRLAAEVAQSARGNYAAGMRAGAVEAPLANATLGARTGGPPVGEKLVGEGRQLLKTDATGAQPKTRGWTQEERDRLAAAITPTGPEKAANAAAGWFGKEIPSTATFGIPERMLRGFSAGGIQRRWEDAAAQMRARSPLYQSQTRGAVPVAGPGMGPVGQATVGAGTAEAGTPYNDDREALAWAAMRGLMQ